MDFRNKSTDWHIRLAEIDRVLDVLPKPKSAYSPRKSGFKNVVKKAVVEEEVKEEVKEEEKGEGKVKEEKEEKEEGGVNEEKHTKSN